MNVVLDTNAYSDWLRNGSWGAELSSASEVIIPAIVLGELREGFLRGNRAAENEKVLMGILNQSCVRVGEVGSETSHYLATLKGYLKGKGTPIPENDVWIAACVCEHGAILLTRDQHFDRLPQVMRG